MKMNEQKYNTIIQSIDKLIELANDGQVPDPTLGICYNLSELSGWDCYNLVGEISMSWEHHQLQGTAYTSFPVVYGKYKWVGEQLNLRVSLMEHIKTHLNTYDLSNIIELEMRDDD